MDNSTPLSDQLELFRDCRNVKSVCRIVAVDLGRNNSEALRLEVRALLDVLDLKQPTASTLKQLLAKGTHSKDREQKRRAAMRAWYEENKDDHRQRMASYYEVDENRERNKRVNGRWKAETRYASTRMASDPAFALRMKTAGRIKSALKRAVDTPGKKRKTLELLGCSSEEYRVYLEGLFEPGMSWENWGEWHIDHIRPVASFDLSTGDGQEAAFHFSNTRPMWATENMRKGAEFEGRRWRHGDHA